MGKQNKRDIRIRNWIFRIAVTVALSVILFAHFSYKEHKEFEPEGLSFDTGWNYFDGNKYNNIDNLATIVEWNADRPLLVRNIVPELETYYNTLVFRSSNQKVVVKIGGKIIYSYGVNEERSFGSTPGSKWNYVILPDDCGGQSIEVSLESPYDSCAGFVSTFRLGNYEDLQYTFFVGQSFCVVVSVAILIYGMLLVVIPWALSHYTNANKVAGYGYLGLFSIFVAVWALLETQMGQFVYSATSVLTLITFYSLMLIPIAFNAFLREMYFDGSSMICNVLNAVCYGNMAVQTILQLTDAADVYEMVWVSHILIGATCILNVVQIACKYIKTREKRYKRLIIAMAILIGFASIDLCRYYMDDFGDYAKFFRVGILVFVIYVSIWYTGSMLELLRKGVRSEVYERMAYEDVLTGCKNRAYFEEEIKKMDTYHKKYKKIIVVTFDMNNLKYHNDTFGHDAGDELLRKCAYCISSAFKNMGEVARIGGDEFALVLRNVSVEEVEASIAIMNEKAAYYNAGSRYRLDIAYGYAQYNEGEDKNMESVVTRADRNMYTKKREMKGTTLNDK